MNYQTVRVLSGASLYNKSRARTVPRPGVRGELGKGGTEHTFGPGPPSRSHCGTGSCTRWFLGKESGFTANVCRGAFRAQHGGGESRLLSLPVSRDTAVLCCSIRPLPAASSRSEPRPAPEPPDTRQPSRPRPLRRLRAHTCSRPPSGPRPVPFRLAQGAALRGSPLAAPAQHLVADQSPLPWPGPPVLSWQRGAASWAEAHGARRVRTDRALWPGGSACLRWARSPCPSRRPGSGTGALVVHGVRAAP